MAQPSSARADAFGVQTIHVLATAEPFAISRKVAQGTQRWVDVISYDDAPSLVAALHEKEHRSVVTHPEETSN